MRRSLVALFLVAGPSFTCNDTRQPGKTSSQDVRKSVAAAVRTTSAYVGDTKDAYVAKAQGEMDDVDAKLTKLRGEAQHAAADSRAQINASIAKLEKQRDAAGARLTELKNATGDAWRDLAAGVSAAVDDAKASAIDAAKRYD
ncbi:MAG: hypothetical protein H7Z43_13010 [Clostridia bacterium]|nr:hypothetical protein [Deltaproteobacteria bacterium]